MKSEQRREAKDRFPTTRWSLVLRAGGSQSPSDQQALSELIECYWYPLYAFCRRKGNSDHDAMDLTQGFVTHLLSRDRLDSVSSDKGRFRSFLLASFKNYMANEHRAANALRRGGSVAILSLDIEDYGQRYDREPSTDETPESLFERSWVEALLARVRARLASDYEKAGNEQLFALLEPHLTHQSDATSRDEIGRQLKLSSAAVAMSLHRMRRRYRELLREEVAATVEEPEEIDDELRTLMAIVSRTT